MFFIATLFALFYLVMVAAVNVWMMFIGRFGTGLATGAVSIVANIYIAETAAAKYRGFLGAMFQVHAHHTRHTIIAGLSFSHLSTLMCCQNSLDVAGSSKLSK